MSRRTNLKAILPSYGYLLHDDTQKVVDINQQAGEIDWAGFQYLGARAERGGLSLGRLCPSMPVKMCKGKYR